jgi:hypothetical protein
MPKYFTKDGKEWKGATHKHPSGKVMTGKTHTKTSKELFKGGKQEKKLNVGGTEHVVHKDKKGSVIVHHTKISAGKYDKINLTKMANVKTIEEGVKATKEWHKDNPHVMYNKKDKKDGNKKSNKKITKKSDKKVNKKSSKKINKKGN